MLRDKDSYDLITEKQPKWLLLLRVALGIILLLKGFSFYKDIASLQNMVKKPELSIINNNTEILAFIITYFNILGGIFILVGLFTRWVSLLQIPVILGVIIFVTSEAGMNLSNADFFLAATVLALLFIFVVKGSGPISADEFFKSYKKIDKK